MLIRRYLLHRQLRVRFPALLLADMGVLVSAWILGYLLLPEGVLLGRTGAGALAGTDLLGGSVLLEAARLLAINLAVVSFAIIAPNLLVQSGYPLGYTSLVVITAVFGVTLGTNSFAISIGGKMPPTIDILGSSGLYEIVAYVLAAASTVSIARWRVVGSKAERMPPIHDPSITRVRTFGVVLAITILGLACSLEAWRFAQAVSR